VFLVTEAFVPSFVVLGPGAIVAFIAVSLVSWDETLGFALASAGSA
jgi:membrane-bound ClpP family serine protease